VGVCDAPDSRPGLVIRLLWALAVRAPNELITIATSRIEAPIGENTFLFDIIFLTLLSGKAVVCGIIFKSIWCYRKTCKPGRYIL
jgi:hypothetical protein